MGEPGRNNRWVKELSCNALDAITRVQVTGTSATEEEIEAAQEELDTRECEGGCPCETCEEEKGAPNGG